ncbi:MAG: hypothetical protein KDI69_10670 [Xanthomonadales bacterium]|nr:hypothetical protein [Xanthomonadales bacterium]
MKVLVLSLMGLSVAAAQESANVQLPVQSGENVSFAYADVLRAIPTYDEVASAPSECAVAEADDADDADAPSVDHVLTLGIANASARTCEVDEPQPQERRITGYEVEYRYRGEIYMSHMGYDPGDKLRIRISVAPAD